MVECSPATRAARVPFPDDAGCFLWKIKIFLLQMALSQKVFSCKRWKKILETRGIDPRTSHMLSERSTIWATSPSCNMWCKNSCVYQDNGHVSHSRHFHLYFWPTWLCVLCLLPNMLCLSMTYVLLYRYVSNLWFTCLTTPHPPLVCLCPVLHKIRCIRLGT